MTDDSEAFAAYEAFRANHEHETADCGDICGECVDEMIAEGLEAAANAIDIELELLPPHDYDDEDHTLAAAAIILRRRAAFLRAL